MTAPAAHGRMPGGPPIIGMSAAMANFTRSWKDGGGGIPGRIPATSPDLMGYIDHKLGGGPVSDGQVRIVLRFGGVLDEARLGRAVRLALDAEPVVGCRFVERPLRPYWQRCNGLEGAFTFRIVGPGEQDGAANAFLLAPMDPFNGPQASVGLFRSGSDTLCIRMSHIVADGGASIEFLRLLSGIYRRLEADPEYRPAVNLRGSRSSFQALRHVRLSRILASCARISVSGPSWSLFTQGRGRSGPTGRPESPAFYVRRIPPDRLAWMKEYAKSRGVTMGDLLIAAYYRALFAVADPPENLPLRMLVPVNLRRYIPGGAGESLCSLSAGYFPAIRRKKGEAFDDTLARVHDRMETNKQRREELGQLFLMELAFAPGYILPRLLGQFISSVQAVPTFSNIGVVDGGAADFGGIPVREFLPAGPIAYPPYFVLGSSTFEGEMALTSIVRATGGERARADRLFEALLGELPCPPP